MEGVPASWSPTLRLNPGAATMGDPIPHTGSIRQMSSNINPPG
ncbi:hypothetical protein SynA1825c_01123 [Synechococcus sp. A18-25c]|nr:hypothetical protein SynA1560_01133 [Synechococcus sp. A15-60]QNJ19433.1 hypothetical protein SynA1825c_01123 [Synechococcus sp. A18-25c]